MHHRVAVGASGYPSPLPKGKQQPRLSKWRWSLLGLCAAGLALLQLVHILQMSNSVHAGGGSRKARGGDAFGNNNLQELYGREAWPRHVDGPSNLLVLGYHNTGAPLMTRLLMLMGAFAGFASELNTDADRTQGWELREVTHINSLAVSPALRPGSLPWMALGFNATRALRGPAGDYYRQRVGAVLGYLKPKQPWVTSEPLLPWLAGVWLETLEDPLCLLLYRSPRAVASELSQLQVPGVEGAGVADLHMLRWADATLAALQSCRGVATLVWPAQLLAPPFLEAGAPALLEHLKAAGVQGLQLPSANALQQHYLEGMGLIPGHHQRNPRVARRATFAAAAAAGGALRPGAKASSAGLQPKQPEKQLSTDYSRLQHTSDWLELDLTGAPVKEMRLGAQAADGDSSSSSNSVPPIEAEVMDGVLRSHLRSVVPYLQVESKYRTTAATLLKAYQAQLLATQQGGGGGTAGALRRMWTATAR